MNRDRFARTTALAALALSSLAVAASSTGCDRGSHDQATREPSRAAPASPAAATPPVAGPGQRGEPAAAPPAPQAKSDNSPAATSTPAPVIAAPEVKRASSADGALELRRLVVTRAIENREPVATSEFHADGEPILAFLDLKNPEDAAAAVVVTFEHESGETVGHVSLEIPAKSSRWRTWARTRLIKKTGAWAAVVRTSDGKELARQDFEVRG